MDELAYIDSRIKSQESAIRAYEKEIEKTKSRSWMGESLINDIIVPKRKAISNAKEVIKILREIKRKVECYEELVKKGITTEGSTHIEQAELQAKAFTITAKVRVNFHFIDISSSAEEYNRNQDRTHNLPHDFLYLDESFKVLKEAYNVGAYR